MPNKKMHTLTPYAEQLLSKAAAAGAVVREVFPSPDWISTVEAGELKGYSESTIRRLCYEGFFVQGQDWRQRPPKPGRRQGGVIRIRRSALSKLDGEG